MSAQKNSTNYATRVCEHCGKEYNGHHNSRICDDCKPIVKKIKENEYSRLRSIKKFPDGSDPDSFVECAICGFRSPDIGTHIKLHGIEPSDYRKTYGHVLCANSLASRTGENNPAYNHGGKYSPFSKKFVQYKGDEYIADIKKKGQETKNNNNNNSTRIEYYTARGLSEEDAVIALSERQRTFSLEKCIEKYLAWSNYLHQRLSQDLQ